jgi:hypothetical protein
MFWKKKKPKKDTIQVNICVSDEEIEKGDIQDIIDPLWYSVSIYDGEERYNSDLSKFSIPQRYVFAIQWYITEVNNGGHDQFYFNSTGIVWKDALKGFEEIGHEQSYNILKESAERLGGSISLDRFKRQEQLEISEVDFEDLDSKFYNILDIEEFILRYIKNHKSDFYFKGVVQKLDI